MRSSYFTGQFRSLLFLCALLFAWEPRAIPAAGRQTEAHPPLQLHPDNPHYFLFRGKPTILITSGEHYGAVMNLDFDYAKYLGTLEKDGLNLTRTFTGAYVEPKGAFNIQSNTLAPASARFIAPWPRSTTPGYAGGGNKFDLTQWNETYFARLKDFVAQAVRSGVVVEMNLFCPFYEEVQWKISPQNAINNINGLGAVPRTNVYTLDKNGGLLEIQEKLVRKIVGELNAFDNVYYEVCNEPYFGGVTLEWQHRMAEVIASAERNFPQQHLISRNVANGAQKIDRVHPAFSIFNFHYAIPPNAITQNYLLHKAIGDNETGFLGTNDAPYRMEAWDFIVAGGALFNNLDYSFTVGHEDGTFVYPATQPGGGNPEYRRQLGVLRDFINGFDFVKMKPDTNVIHGGQWTGMSARALSQSGRAYAIYLRPVGTPARERKGDVWLELEMPGASYAAEWIEPITGKVIREEKFVTSGLRRLNAPLFSEDVALRIRAHPQGNAATESRPKLN